MSDSVQLPEPAAHLSARVRTDWNRGYTAYEVEEVGTFTLIPVLDCPQGWSDPRGRVLPCNHVQVYMGTGGPHTRSENRRNVPVVAGHTLAGPLKSNTRPEPGGLEAGARSVFIAWNGLPPEVGDEAGRIVKALAAHWGQSPDVDHVKAAYARAQAPRLARRAVKRTNTARGRFEQAGRELVQALADEQHQEHLRETENAEQAAALIRPHAPAWGEYSIYANRHMDSDRLLVGVVVDAAGNVVDDGANSGKWQPVATVVVATSPQEAVAEMLRQIEEGEQE